MQIPINFSEVGCAACQLLFMITTDFEERRRKDHNSFYCPNGHSNSYSQKSKEDILRDRLEAKDETIKDLEKKIIVLKKPKPRKKVQTKVK